jgi:transposase-like protein
MKKSSTPTCPDCGSHAVSLDAIHTTGQYTTMTYTTMIYICQACNHTFLDEVKNALPA